MAEQKDFRVKNGLVVEGATITFQGKEFEHLVDSADVNTIATNAASATAIALAIALG